MFCYKNRYIHVRTGAPALIRCGRTMCFVHHETQTDDVPAGSHLVRPADPMTSHTLYYGMWDCHRAASDNRSELVTFDPQSSRRASWFFPFVRTRLWLNALHVFIKGFLSNQMKMRRFLVSAARLQRVSARRLSVQTKDSSHDVIFALRDVWRRKNNHGCTDKLCINGTCRVIIL